MLIHQTEKEFLSWMGSANAANVGVTCFKVLSAIQDAPRETQILGSAALFLTMCQEWGASPVEVLQITDNILTKNQGLEQIAALRQYIRNEI